jgi:KDO2-lipid IV(A) lauroyltransferase
LSRVVGAAELERTVDAAFRSYARYWVETLRVPKPGIEAIRSRTTAEGLDNLARHLDAGRGVIFVTPHLGSWDIAGGWLASHGWRVLAIAEELQPPELFELFCRLRRAVGIEVFPLGKASSARALLAGLREGAALGLVADRDISGAGIEVEFFGEKTYLPTGPAVMAMRTGAPIAAGALLQRPGGRYHGVILDPIEVEPTRDPASVRQITERVARDLETLIQRDPGQWHLCQPNWPSDPGYRS